MRISIALATYNGARNIKEQLESYAAQSIIPDELIVCDDGSTDETVEIISDFREMAPFEIILINNENNLGHVQNFAKAISLCTGDVVFLSDQDDKWFPSKIESIVRVFHQNPKCWIVIHDGELTDGQLGPSGQTKMTQIQRGYGTAENISTGALSAVRRDLLKYALPIPSGISAHDTWLHKVASILPARRIVLKQTLQYIRRHDKNTSSWVVNSGKKLTRLDVIRDQANTAPAYDYTDRLAINTGLKNAIIKIDKDLKGRSDLRATQRAKMLLARERKAIHSRQTLVGFNWLKRKLYASYMLLTGQYLHFNGIQSFIRDVIR